MSESLIHFRVVCREAFAFLATNYGFREVATSQDSESQYIVEFSNDDISLRIIGEGYGTVARVEYTGQDGRPIPSTILEPTWQPNAWRKKHKRASRTNQSQDEQIRAAAERIRERDQDILLRNYVRLQEASSRWQQVLSTLTKQLTRAQ